MKKIILPDGPCPAGLRYCVNSLALEIEETQTGASVRLYLNSPN